MESSEKYQVDQHRVDPVEPLSPNPVFEPTFPEKTPQKYISPLERDEPLSSNSDIPTEAEPPIYPPVDKRQEIMSSQEFYWAGAFTNALLMNGMPYEDYDELIDEAIAIRDKLIERVSES